METIISKGGFTAIKRDKPDRRFVRVSREQIEAYGPDIGLAGIGLLTLLALHADNENRRCWPSNQRLAEMSGSTPQTIRNQMRKLNETNPDGLIKIWPQGKRSSGIYYRKRFIRLLDNLAVTRRG